MSPVTAGVAVAALVTIVVVLYLGGPWALLGLGFIALAGAAIYGRASAVAPASSRRRRRRKRSAARSAPQNSNTSQNGR